MVSPLEKLKAEVQRIKNQGGNTSASDDFISKYKQLAKKADLLLEQRQANERAKQEYNDTSI